MASISMTNMSEEVENGATTEEVCVNNKGVPASFKSKTDDLLVILSTGKSVARRTVQTLCDKEYPRNPYSPEQTLRRNENRTRTRRAYVADGMTSAGYIRRDTRIFIEALPKDPLFHNHPMFHDVPYLVTRRMVQLSWLDELRSIEEEIRSSYRSTKHKYGANMGYNLGISIVSGGSYAAKSKNVSGSIHTASLVKQYPDLGKRIVDCFKKILHANYGNQGWYKRLLLITTQLNQQSKERRTIPGLPLSGLWLTEQPNGESVHCDRNVVGATFLLTTSDAKGSTLWLSSPTQKLAKYDLKPGFIVSGSWASHAHCNVKVDERPGNSRTSWTLYLDGRVFSRKFMFVDHAV
jgi:hypothetical protein